jgi:predicted negative regulator of RcsB-dependent stress response
MDDNQRRVWLYGVGGCVLAGLSYGGFFYEAEPELAQLLSSANVQLRLAYSIPAQDGDGQPVQARISLLDAAEQNLLRARRQDPDSAVLVEFEGFLLHLRGDHAGAAERYRRAREMADAAAGQQATLCFNEARMRAQAGQVDVALTVLQESHDSFSPELQLQSRLEQAGYLMQLNRRTQAIDLLVQAAGMQAPMARVHAAKSLVQLGAADRAEAVLAQGLGSDGVAEYHLARLKLDQGDVDSSLQLLRGATQTAPAEVWRLVREDRDAWRGVEQDARFQELEVRLSATPSR